MKQHNHVVVVGTHYDPVQSAKTGGSGIACHRICRALAMQPNVRVTLICTADSPADGLEEAGVTILHTETKSTNAIDKDMTTAGYDFIGSIFYDQVGTKLGALVCDVVVFNAAYHHAKTIQKHTQGQWNIVHVPYGKNPWGERYPTPELGFRELAVSGPQFRAGEEHDWYDAYLDNCVPVTSDDLPCVNHVWPPQNALFVGRLVPEKGVDLAIAACEQMRYHRFAPDLELSICGIAEDGTYAKTILENLPPWATYHGNVDWTAVQKLMMQADLGFFTSNPRNNWSEAFGMVGIEMLVHGVPIVGIEGMGFLPDYARPETCLVMPWEPTLHEMPFNPRFGDEVVIAADTWHPDPHACQESVQELTLDRYGAKLLSIVTGS